MATAAPFASHAGMSTADKGDGSGKAGEVRDDELPSGPDDPKHVVEQRQEERRCNCQPLYTKDRHRRLELDTTEERDDRLRSRDKDERDPDPNDHRDVEELSKCETETLPIRVCGACEDREADPAMSGATGTKTSATPAESPKYPVCSEVRGGTS